MTLLVFVFLLIWMSIITARQACPFGSRMLAVYLLYRLVLVEITPEFARRAIVVGRNKMEERRRLVAGGNLLQAHTWKGLLESSGIEVELRGEALLGGVGELPVDLQNVELWVCESQYELAKTQLESLNADGPQWQCVKCHEMNEDSFELCWHCSAERCVQHN